MQHSPRRARVRALAKINLSLEILNKRPDGFHNLRTIFQTISLADTLHIEFSPGRKTRLSIVSDIEIPDNLVLRAAERVLQAAKITGEVRFRLTKNIPMGGGLGGGSSDAAAVLLALPVLAGRVLPLGTLVELASELGSDIPFFLVGGTALGIGRGTEIYPVADTRAERVAVVAPGVHVSTAEAYRALGRSLTSPELSPKINSSQSLVLSLGGGLSAEGWAGFCSNDFEGVVFRLHPKLGAIKKKLKKAGAMPALMSGSGAALFGIFPTSESLQNCSDHLQGEDVRLVSFVSRARYQAMWRRQLSEHIESKTWPPRSRYVQ